jgi:hypothetical protein
MPQENPSRLELEFVSGRVGPLEVVLDGTESYVDGLTAAATCSSGQACPRSHSHPLLQSHPVASSPVQCLMQRPRCVCNSGRRNSARHAHARYMQATSPRQMRATAPGAFRPRWPVCVVGIEAKSMRWEYGTENVAVVPAQNRTQKKRRSSCYLSSVGGGGFGVPVVS